MTTIYVGNLPFSATEQDIKVLFERHGLNADLIYVDSAPAVQALDVYQLTVPLGAVSREARRPALLRDVLRSRPSHPLEGPVRSG